MTKMNGTTYPPHPSDDRPLPPQLQAAFDRLQADRTKLERIPHHYPRAVRLGCDYAMQAAGVPRTDREADSFAWMAVVLADLQERDPPGDPPATYAAQCAAERAGQANAEAFALLGQLRDDAHVLAGRGVEVEALPGPAMKVLQTAASGQRLSDAKLAPVLRQARILAERSGWLVLHHLRD